MTVPTSSIDFSRNAAYGPTPEAPLETAMSWLDPRTSRLPDGRFLPEILAAQAPWVHMSSAVQRALAGPLACFHKGERGLVDVRATTACVLERCLERWQNPLSGHATSCPRFIPLLHELAELGGFNHPRARLDEWLAKTVAYAPIGWVDRSPFGHTLCAREGARALLAKLKEAGASLEAPAGAPGKTCLDIWWMRLGGGSGKPRALLARALQENHAERLLTLLVEGMSDLPLLPQGAPPSLLQKKAWLLGSVAVLWKAGATHDLLTKTDGQGIPVWRLLVQALGSEAESALLSVDVTHRREAGRIIKRLQALEANAALSTHLPEPFATPSPPARRRM